MQIVQLQELFEVRHSVFVVGNAGPGKIMVWKSLFRANQNMKKKPMCVDINPKAVTNDEDGNELPVAEHKLFGKMGFQTMHKDVDKNIMANMVDL